MSVRKNLISDTRIPANMNRVSRWLRQMRAPFITASIMPVIVGFAGGYYYSNSFEPVLFILACVSMACFNAGANLTNEYFDHITGNDMRTEHTRFSGGSGLIQDGTHTARAVKFAGLIAFAIAVLTGLLILMIRPSFVIFLFGAAGLAGAYLYTAKPAMLCYRGLGEITIAALFGILPVTGSFYLAVQSFEPFILFCAVIVSIHIFLVIFINEFQDIRADSAVSKKTLVVIFGPAVSARISYLLAAISCLTAGAGIFLFPGIALVFIAHLLTIPLTACACLRIKEDLFEPPYRYTPNRLFIYTHSLSALLMAAGFLVSAQIGA